jgi:hypothetical protein
VDNNFVFISKSKNQQQEQETVRRWRGPAGEEKRGDMRRKREGSGVGAGGS